MAATSEQTNWLVRVGALRDGLLVLASILYGLGYLVWSVHAWEQDLGLLPALDAQYFVAGVFPALVFLAAFYAYRLITRAVEQLLDWLYSEPRTRTKTLARGLAYALVVVPAIILFLRGISGYVKSVLAWEWAWAVLFGAMLLGSILYHTHGAIVTYT